MSKAAHRILYKSRNWLIAEIKDGKYHYRTVGHLNCSGTRLGGSSDPDLSKAFDTEWGRAYQIEWAFARQQPRILKCLKCHKVPTSKYFRILVDVFKAHGWP